MNLGSALVSRFFLPRFLATTSICLLVLSMLACGGANLDAADSHQYPKVSITTTALPDATVGTAYNFTMAATGGNGSEFLWAIDPATLPPGVSFGLSGAFSGKPTTAGTFPLSVSVKDTCFCVPQNQPQQDTKVFNLVIR